jgi:glycosyltransferase involved in cell wall biosynthesis
MYLAQAIESILQQTYGDFELILCDNASTDETGRICQDYANGDKRIRYYRNRENIGGARNENLTIMLARGEYFRWAAHDDYLEPTLLEACIDVLDRQIDVVLCYTQVRQLDLIGGTDTIISRNNGASRHPGARFRRILLSRDFLEETYGLMRLDVLRSTNLQADYVASDRTLMAELSLHGRFHEVPEALFVKRIHGKNVYTDWRTRIAWFKPQSTPSVNFPWWAQLKDIVETSLRAPVSPAVRMECLSTACIWTIVRSPNLAKDLVMAALGKARGAQSRARRFAESQNWH